MTSRALTVLLSLFCAGSLGAQGGLRWGEFGYFSNWDRYSYGIDSKYEFLGTLPELTQFPRLLEMAVNPIWNETEQTIIFSQMRTLSRCDFERDQDGRLKVAVRRQKAVEAWQEWWERYGRELSEELSRTGKPHAEAWKVVAPTPYLECPKYPIAIPRVWSSTISFMSGGIGSVTREEIEMHVNGDVCELSRKYAPAMGPQILWTHESWEDLTRAEADRFFAAVVYAIDNPWFFLGDQIADEDVANDGKPERPRNIRGRPEAWFEYNAFVEWSGFWIPTERSSSSVILGSGIPFVVMRPRSIAALAQYSES